jgi:hypothetical protein
VTTQGTYLSISGIEVYTGEEGETEDDKEDDDEEGESTTSTYNVPANTKCGVN